MFDTGVNLIKKAEDVAAATVQYETHVKVYYDWKLDLEAFQKTVMLFTKVADIATPSAHQVFETCSTNLVTHITEMTGNVMILKVAAAQWQLTPLSIYSGTSLPNLT